MRVLLFLELTGSIISGLRDLVFDTGSVDLVFDTGSVDLVFDTGSGSVDLVFDTGSVDLVFDTGSVDLVFDRVFDFALGVKDLDRSPGVYLKNHSLYSLESRSTLSSLYFSAFMARIVFMVSCVP